MGDKKKEYRDKRTGMQTVRSAIFAIVLIITGFISIIYVCCGQDGFLLLRGGKSAVD